MQRKPKVALDHRSGDLCGALSSVPNGQCCGYSSILWSTNAYNPDIDNLFYMPYPQKMLFQGSLLTRTVPKTNCNIYYFVLVLKISGHFLGGWGGVCVSSRETIFLLGPFPQVLGEGLNPRSCLTLSLGVILLWDWPPPLHVPRVSVKDSRGIKKFLYIFPIVLLPAQKIVEVP